MTKEYCTLEFPDELDSRAAAIAINEKLKEGWIKADQFKYDVATKIFTYFFKREKNDI